MTALNSEGPVSGMAPVTDLSAQAPVMPHHHDCSEAPLPPASLPPHQSRHRPHAMPDAARSDGESEDTLGNSDELNEEMEGPMNPPHFGHPAPHLYPPVAAAVGHHGTGFMTPPPLPGSLHGAEHPHPLFYTPPPPHSGSMADLAAPDLVEEHPIADHSPEHEAALSYSNCPVHGTRFFYNGAPPPPPVTDCEWKSRPRTAAARFPIRPTFPLQRHAQQPPSQPPMPQPHDDSGIPSRDLFGTKATPVPAAPEPYYHHAQQPHPEQNFQSVASSSRAAYPPHRGRHGNFYPSETMAMAEQFHHQYPQGNRFQQQQRQPPYAEARAPKWSVWRQKDQASYPNETAEFGNRRVKGGYSRGGVGGGQFNASAVSSASNPPEANRFGHPSQQQRQPRQWQLRNNSNHANGAHLSQNGQLGARGSHQPMTFKPFPHPEFIPLGRNPAAGVPFYDPMIEGRFYGAPGYANGATPPPSFQDLAASSFASLYQPRLPVWLCRGESHHPAPTSSPTPTSATPVEKVSIDASQLGHGVPVFDNAFLKQLGDEVSIFADWVRPRESEMARRQMLIDTVRSMISELWPTASVDIYGSSECGLSLPSSDVDFVINDVDFNSRTAGRYLEQLSDVLRRRTDVKDLDVIPSARVPLIKFHHRPTDIWADITFCVPNARSSVELVRKYLTIHPIARPLVMVLKTLLRQSGLHAPRNGGLGSYAVAMLVVCFLRMRNEAISRGRSAPAVLNDKDPTTTGAVLVQLLWFLATHHYRDAFTPEGPSPMQPRTFLPVSPDAFKKKDPHLESDSCPDSSAESDTTSSSMSGEGERMSRPTLSRPDQVARDMRRAAASLATERMEIIDPLDPANDVTRGCTQFKRVKELFFFSLKALASYNPARFPSTLSSFINPDDPSLTFRFLSAHTPSNSDISPPPPPSSATFMPLPPPPPPGHFIPLTNHSGPLMMPTPPPPPMMPPFATPPPTLAALPIPLPTHPSEVVESCGAPEGEAEGTWWPATAHGFPEAVGYPPTNESPSPHLATLFEVEHHSPEELLRALDAVDAMTNDLSEEEDAPACEERPLAGLTTQGQCGYYNHMPRNLNLDIEAASLPDSATTGLSPPSEEDSSSLRAEASLTEPLGSPEEVPAL